MPSVEIAPRRCTMLCVVAAAGMLLTRPAQADEDLDAGARRVTLAEAVEVARRNQPTLRQSEATIDVAEARVEQARAAYLPQLTGTAQYQRTTGNFVPRPGAVVNTPTRASWSTTTYDFFSFGANASQLIFDFGQTSARARAARANVEAARANALGTESQVLLDVRRAYFEARTRRELVSVAAEGVTNQERHLAQIQGFVSAGMRPDIDRARVQTDLENARVQLITARNDYWVARATLAQSVGWPLDERAAQGIAPADDDFPAVPQEDAPIPTLVEQALRDRPELASFERQRRAQEAVVRATRGAYGPALSAIASASESGTRLDDLVPNWLVGATLAWPILQGGLTTGLLHEAQAQLRAVTAQEDVFRLSVRVEVEQAALSVRAAKATAAATERALAAARDQLRLAEARYATGLGSAIELGDAQVAATTAAGQAVAARHSVAQARAALVSALGQR